VLLVPNTYLETPNYKVQRLRHDDLNQGEPLPASFDMMERPEEEDVLKQKKEEAREPRQEAAVKGIPPGLPAPMPVERAPVNEAPRRENWLTTVMTWFKRGPSEPEVVPTPAPQRRDAPRDERGRGPKERPERRDQREGRGDDRHRGRRDGQRGEPREQRDAQKQRPPQGAPQQPRRDRDGSRDAAREGQRPPRPPREAKPPQAPRHVDPSVPAIAQGEPGATQGAERGEGGHRRRDRRRGGRGRGERDDQATPRSDRPEGQAGRGPETRRPAPPSGETTEMGHAGAEARVPLGAPEVPMAPVSIHAEPESTFIHAEPPPPALHIEPASKLEPRLAESTTVRAESAESLPRNAPEIPKVSLELPPDSGLVLVETSHAAPPPVDETEVRRPHRVRAPRAKIVEEPLQLVETQHKEPPAA